MSNYGFCLDDINSYDELQFRVILGVNPKGTISLAQELFPTDKILEDEENLDYTTEILKFQMNRVSPSMMAYLRSVLLNNYTGADSELIMVSSPRVIEYELIVLEFAIDLL